MYDTEKRQRLNIDRVNTLVPELQRICLEGIDKLEQAGYEPLILEGWRSQETQDAYYAQGRLPLYEVNVLREHAGLEPLNESENSRIITRAKISNHSKGTAFDIVSVNSGIVDYDDKNFIEFSGIVFEKLGLKWGYHFTNLVDAAHFEL